MKPSELDEIASAIDRVLKLDIQAPLRFGMMLRRMRTKIDGDVAAFRTAKLKLVEENGLRGAGGRLVLAGPGSIKIDPAKAADYLAGMADLDKDNRELAACGLEIVPFELWPASLPIDAAVALGPIMGDPPAPAAT